MKIEIYYNYPDDDETYQLKVKIPWSEIAQAKLDNLNVSDENIVKNIAIKYLNLLRGKEAQF